MKMETSKRTTSLNEQKVMNVGMPEMIRTYTIQLKVTRHISFNYFPGFILRNALVGAMADLYCHKQREQNIKPGGCAACAYVNGCIYHKLNLPTPDRKAPKQQPYLIDADDLEYNERFSENGVFHFRLTLFGWANDYLPQWTEAIKHAGANMGIGQNSGRFELLGVTPDMGSGAGLSRNAAAVRLDFKYLHFYNARRKIPNSGMLFSALMHKIQERYNALSVLYGDGQPIDIAEPSAVEVAQSRFSILRLLYPPGGTTAYYDCYKGYLHYTGQLKPYLKTLYTGSRIGIGQLTPAGLGRYTVQLV